MVLQKESGKTFSLHDTIRYVFDKNLFVRIFTLSYLIFVTRLSLLNRRRIQARPVAISW
jgi:hypothetical protein